MKVSGVRFQVSGLDMLKHEDRIQETEVRRQNTEVDNTLLLPSSILTPETSLGFTQMPLSFR